MPGVEAAHQHQRLGVGQVEVNEQRQAVEAIVVDPALCEGLRVERRLGDVRDRRRHLVGRELRYEQEMHRLDRVGRDALLEVADTPPGRHVQGAGQDAQHPLAREGLANPNQAVSVVAHECEHLAVVAKSQVLRPVVFVEELIAVEPLVSSKCSSAHGYPPGRFSSKLRRRPTTLPSSRTLRPSRTMGS